MAISSNVARICWAVIVVLMIRMLVVRESDASSLQQDGEDLSTAFKLVEDIVALEARVAALEDPPHIYFVHRTNKANIGDWFCTPFFYFPVLARLSDTRAPPPPVTHQWWSVLAGPAKRHSERRLAAWAIEGRPGYGTHIDLEKAEQHIDKMSVQFPCKIVVVGGGGLLMDKWLKVLPRLCERFPCALWGPGLNNGYHLESKDGTVPPAEIQRVRESSAPPSYMNIFKLGGIRDYNISGGPYRYLPDASCLAPVFDGQCSGAATTQSVCYYAHKDFRTSAFRERFGADAGGKDMVLTNTGNFTGAAKRDLYADFSELTRYFCSCETVVTSSFHGVIWAQYLGKKVILAFPGSSKFFTFRHPPRYYTGDLQADIAAAPAYPDAFSECRRLNLEFYRDVLEYVVHMASTGQACATTSLEKGKEHGAPEG